MKAPPRTGPPFRAEHIGSLLRPEGLRAAYRDFSEGRVDAAGFRQAQDDAVRQVVAFQEGLGFRAVNDGEFRRVSYWAHFVEAVGGMDVRQSRFDFRDGHGTRTHFLAPCVTGPLRRGKSISGEEFDFLRAVAKVTPKITMPSPPTMHFWQEKGTARAAGYADDGALLADLARVYREEIADLGQRGATYIQIDDVPLVMLCDGELRAQVVAGGDDPERLLDAYVNLFREALKGRPAGMTAALHLCRGNFKGRWLVDGGYDYIAERLFNEIPVDGFCLEYDTPRAGDFGPLAAVPRDKLVVLGLVSTKNPALESKADLLRRIEEATRYIPLEQLAISPQCGFASTVAGNPVTFDDEQRKLALVVEVAREVWG